MMIRLRYWPFLCLLGLALASPAHPAKAQDGKRGIYVALTGMYVIPRDSERTVQHEDGTASTDLTFEDGRGILGALGYSFGSGLRAEVEIGYRRAEVDELERFELIGRVSTISSMLNGIFDFEAGKLRPYVGGGLGIAHHEMDFQREIVISGSRFELRGTNSLSDTVLAYQAMIGVGYPLSDRADVHAGYRYFGTSKCEYDDTAVTYGAHNFEVGVRFRF